VRRGRSSDGPHERHHSAARARRLSGQRRGDQRFDELSRYLDHLEALGVREWVDMDLSIVRGLAYYTGIVFELFDARNEFRAICGGGRYDTLLESLSGTDLPALGFGMGDVVLGELLKAGGKSEQSIVLDYWVAFEDQSQLAEAMRVATLLRRQSSSVEYALRPQPLGKQLDGPLARRARARRSSCAWTARSSGRTSRPARKNLLHFEWLTRKS